MEFPVILNSPPIVCEVGTPGRSKSFHDAYYGRMGRDNTIPVGDPRTSLLALSYASTLLSCCLFSMRCWDVELCCFSVIVDGHCTVNKTNLLWIQDYHLIII